MKEILVYSTRIEISPYSQGEFPQLEKMCSIWDKTEHRYIPRGYCITDNKIIIPRGISLIYLQKLCKSTARLVYNNSNPARMKYNYEMNCSPRDDNQKQAIDFLLSKNGFENGTGYSQLSLNLDTGFGKTYCAINALLKNKIRGIIITHREAIKEQWIETFKDKTDVPEDRILNISGSHIIDNIVNGDNDYDIYLVNHQTITSYAKAHGWDSVTKLFEILDVGVKIVDEAHLCFQNIIYIDFFTNVKRNYYLTATFERSDPKEISLFKKVFANTLRFGENLKSRKHIIYTFVFYNSNPSPKDKVWIRTNYGVSSYRFSEYAFEKDQYRTILSVLVKVCDKCIKIDGKTLIVVPKIDNTNTIRDILRTRYPNLEINSVNSKNSDDENNNYKEKSDIIVTTIKGMGVGSDVKGLRNLIIMEPHSSRTVSNQLIGRLREYAPDKDTYAYEIVDTGFPSIVRMIGRRYPSIKNKCKEVIQTKILNIF